MTGEPTTIIRCSALSNYADCPRRGAARLFRAEIRAAGFTLRDTIRGIGAAVGVAVHKSATVILDEKARTGALPSENVATDAAHETVLEQIREGVTYDGPRGATTNRVQAEHQVLTMSRVYFHQVAPNVEPIMTEERLEAEIAPGVLLSGQPDVVCHEPRAVRDLKTGARPPGSFAPQIGGYSLLVRSHGYDIAQASIDYIKRAPISKAQPDPVTVSVALEQAEVAASSILKHVIGDLETFRHGDAERRIMPGDIWSFPANPQSMLCGEKWCPCWGVSGSHAFCNEWRPK